MLQLININKSYNKTKVLSDISFTFEEGKVYSILGGNGAGRTTLFECLSGDLCIDSGRIITKEKSHVFLASKQSVLPVYLTGLEFIQFLCKLNQIDEEPDAFLDRVGINEEERDMLIYDYSFILKKRLQLAAYLIQKPYVIMFDEPFDYCDEDYINSFLEVINSEKTGHIIIISTGLLPIAEKISKDLIVLNNGELNYVPRATMNFPEVRNAIKDILEEADNGIIV